MKNTIIKSIAILCGLVVFSCGDELDTQPRQTVSTDQALITRQDFFVGITGVYAGMISTNYYGRNFMAIADASSDNGNIPAGAGARLTAFYTLAINANSGALGTWERIYAQVGSVNNIINKVDGAVGASQDEKDQIKGEGLFLRALFHHDLVRLFAHDYFYTADASHDGVPYMTASSIGSPARNSVAEVYNMILDDLDNAISLLAGNDRTTDDHSSFASEMSAYALRARVKLYMRDYTGALSDANYVINNGGYTLTPYKVLNPDLSVDLTKIDSWANRLPTSESIFELEVDINDGFYPGLEGLASIYQRDDGYGDLGPNLDIVNMYDANDVRKNWYKNTGGVWFTEKYPGQGGNNIQFTVPVLRLTEMYLIKAECQAAQNQDADAATTINLITSRANAPTINSVGDQLDADIQDERRRELAFEGHRYFDIKRLQMDIVRNDCTLLDNCVIAYGDKLFAYPIPQQEIDANSNMTQNPGY